MSFDPFKGFVQNATPSIYDVQRRQALAKQLGSIDYAPNSGALGALAQALGGAGSAYQNTAAAGEAQQGQDQATQALAKALGGGYAGIQADPGAYASAAGNPFLPQGAVTAANSYVGTQGQLAQQSAENAAILDRQKQQQQFELSTPQPINYGTTGFFNRATGETTPVNGGGTGAPVGTVGNPSIDPTMDGYSTKPVANTGLTQAAIDQSALQYLMTGSPPSIGRSAQGQFIRNAVINRAAEIDPTGNLASNKTQLKALSSALTDQTKYAANTERAFNTANDTLDALLGFMQKNGVNPSDYPDVNAMGNGLQAHGKDASGIIAAYKAQLQTLRQEYSQVLAKGGQRSVETDRESAALIPDNLGPAKLQQVADQIKIDAQNAIREAGNQTKKVQDQIAGLGTPSAAPSSSASPDDPLGLR